MIRARSTRVASVRGFVLRNLLLALLYAAAARVGLTLPLPLVDGQVTLVWLSAGLAMATLLLFGLRYWPGLVLGSLIQTGLGGAPPLYMVMEAVGSPLEAVVGAVLLHRLGFRNSVDRFRDVINFTIYGVALSPVISASIGTLALWLTGSRSPAGFQAVWGWWWLGDAIGIFIFAPMLLTWGHYLQGHRPDRTSFGRRSLTELFLIFFLLVLLLEVTYHWLPPNVAVMPMVYSVVPLMIWAGLRLGPRGVTTALFIMACEAVWHTVHGTGPFAAADLTFNLVNLYGFLASVTIGGLILASLIAERLQAEQALRQSEMRYRSLAESSGVGIWETTLDGRTTYSNPAMIQMLGLESAEALAGRHYRHFFTPESVERIAGMDVLRQQGISGSYEVEMIRANGEQRSVIVYGAPLFDDNRNFYGMIGTFVDITDRKQAVQDLLAEQSFIHTVVDSLPGIFYVLDRHGQLLRWNHNLEQVTGYSHSEIGRIRSMALFDPADHQRVLRAIGRVFQQGEAQLEAMLLTKSGERIPYLFTGRRVLLNGRASLVGMGIDISQRKEAEEALEDTKRHYQAVVENSADGIMLISEDGMVLYQSPSSQRIFGHGPLANRRPLEWGRVHPDDQEEAAEKFQRLLREPGSHLTFEMRYRHPDDTWHWIEAVTTNLLHEPYVQAIVANYRDVTERKQTEEILRRTQKMESLGVMAGGIAHDFNNLLVAILGQTSLVLGRMAADDPNRPHITKAVKAAERAAVLTRQLLAYAGHSQAALQALDLNLLIEENRHLFEVVVPRQVTLVLDLQPGLPPVRGNTGQLQQVLMNLLLNSVQAIVPSPGPGSGGEANPGWPGRGRVTIRTRLHMQQGGPPRRLYTGALLEPGRYVELVVEDTGHGMTPEVVAKIFDPFFTTKEAGHGLGLATVLGIIQGHGGQVQVDSAPGRGTRFRVLFPVSREVPTAEEEATPAGPLALRGVLVIEDEGTVREAIVDMLTAEGVAVFTAGTGAAGVDCYRRRQGEIDLVLLDFSLPDQSGVETLRQLRGVNPAVRVILTSGSQVGFGRVFEEDGAVAFLQKPYDVQMLREVLGRFGGEGE